MSETNPFDAKTTLHCFVQDSTITEGAIKSVLNDLTNEQKGEVLNIKDEIVTGDTPYETATTAGLSKKICDLLDPSKL